MPNSIGIITWERLLHSILQRVGFRRSTENPVTEVKGHTNR